MRYKAKMLEGQIVEGHAELNRAILLQPDDCLFRLWRMILFVEAEAADEAIAEFETISRLYRSNPNDDGICKSSFIAGLGFRGRAYRLKGELDKSLADLNEAIRQKPTFLAYLLDRGQTFALKGDCERAVADFNEVIRRAREYSAKGGMEGAVQSLNLPEAYYQRGMLYCEKREYEKAHLDLSEAIKGANEGDPTHAKFFYARGLNSLERKDPDSAIRDLTEAIRRVPQFVGAYGHRGRAYLMKNELDQAIADLSEAIRLAPNLAETYQFRGQAYEKKGDAAKAHADFAKAREFGWKPTPAPSVDVTDGPRVIKSDPAHNAADLEAGTFDLTIVFDEPMKPTNGALSVPQGAPAIKVIGKARWKDARTWVVPVLLAPGTTYRIGVNTGTVKPFVSAGDGTPAEPRDWTFRTEGAVAPKDR